MELGWRPGLFNYFTVETDFRVLIETGNDWLLDFYMDKKKGSELFRQIIDKLKDEVQIPAEFR